jgi:hypothetical protein
MNGSLMAGLAETASSPQWLHSTEKAGLLILNLSGKSG